MAEINNNNTNNPSFTESITNATTAAANYVNNSLNALKEQKTQEIINTAETEKVILDINTGDFVNALESYNIIVDNYPIADGNLDAYETTANIVKEKLFHLTSQIHESLSAYIVAKKNEIQGKIDAIKNESVTRGGRHMSKKRSKMNKKRKSKKHSR